MNRIPNLPHTDRDRLLHEFTQASSDIVLIADQRRTILFANRAACTKTGYRLRELVGSKTHLLFGKENQARYTSKIAQGLQKKGRWSGEVELRRKDGFTFWIDAVIVGVVDDRGMPAGTIEVGHDLSERRLLDQREWASESHLQHVIDSMEDALCVCDIDGKILMCNEAHCSMLGYRREEIVGLGSPYPWIDPVDVQRIRYGHKLLLKHGTLKNFTVTWRRRDNTSLVASLAISVMRDAAGTVSGFIYNIRDVTDVQYVEELCRSNERIHRLVTDVHRKAERLQTLESINWLVLNNTDVARIFKAVTSGIKKLVAHDLAGIYVYDPQRESLLPHTLSKQTRFSRNIAKFPLPLGEGIIGAAAVTGRMVWVNNAQLDPRSKYPPAMKPDIEHFIAVPLMGRGSFFGVLVVARNRNPEFIEEEAEIVRSFAAAATVALENARLIDELKNRPAGIGRATLPSPSGVAPQERPSAIRRPRTKRRRSHQIDGKRQVPVSTHRPQS